MLLLSNDERTAFDDLLALGADAVRAWPSYQRTYNSIVSCLVHNGPYGHRQYPEHDIQAPAITDVLWSGAHQLNGPQPTPLSAIDTNADMKAMLSAISESDKNKNIIPFRSQDLFPSQYGTESCPPQVLFPPQDFQPPQPQSSSCPPQGFQPSQPQSSSFPLQDLEPRQPQSSSFPPQHFEPSQPQSSSFPPQDIEPCQPQSSSFPPQVLEPSQPQSSSFPPQDREPSQSEPLYTGNDTGTDAHEEEDDDDASIKSDTSESDEDSGHGETSWRTDQALPTPENTPRLNQPRSRTSYGKGMGLPMRFVIAMRKRRGRPVLVTRVCRLMGNLSKGDDVLTTVLNPYQSRSKKGWRFRRYSSYQMVLDLSACVCLTFVQNRRSKGRNLRPKVTLTDRVDSFFTKHQDPLSRRSVTMGPWTRSAPSKSSTGNTSVGSSS
ncbi:hypothetical protein CF319_g7230 [Tilletia indica]|nr:hypothetical protein CF319_g7230 [Tilletia indica]